MTDDGRPPAVNWNAVGFKALAAVVVLIVVSLVVIKVVSALLSTIVVVVGVAVAVALVAGYVRLKAAERTQRRGRR